MAKLAQLETQIKREIVEYLKMRQDCFIWVNTSTGIYDPTRGHFRTLNGRGHLKGVSDILGIWRGKPLAIEVKSETGRLSFDQKVFLDTFQAHGGVAMVARSVEEVIKQMAFVLDQD